MDSQTINENLFLNVLMKLETEKGWMLQLTGPSKINKKGEQESVLKIKDSEDNSFWAFYPKISQESRNFSDGELLEKGSILLEVLSWGLSSDRNLPNREAYNFSHGGKVKIGYRQFKKPVRFARFYKPMMFKIRYIFNNGVFIPAPLLQERSGKGPAVSKEKNYKTVENLSSQAWMEQSKQTAFLFS